MIAHYTFLFRTPVTETLKSAEIMDPGRTVPRAQTKYTRAQNGSRAASNINK